MYFSLLYQNVISIERLRAFNFSFKLASPFNSQPLPLSSQTMSQSRSYHVSSVPKAGRRSGYSRVVGERRFQVLGQPLKILPEFLELAVGHRSRRVREMSKIQGTGQGSVPRAAVAAWRRAARRPLGNVRGEKMSLTSSPMSLRRRANATQPLLIPAW